ncbi:uncharacterized protein TOT_030000575 [Theileria orientalis strain Shintoku]|uniref:Uncharacterized protein n=1 Tax=Theileria orientalis strain Shintoku TaxID=869250 RepID=J4CDK7_THEOR|nr:uncharacterized protein TOT_030000575 [Theileria orientalis strain Shintoku]PVC49756.1 hypothetical protein MACL_00002792 [Theileria orientalis]BAM41312.1 uncharacterized protein TOT_030000575 [Theileria orientalis strain Shintoku]|eukprot:XP_009691613.1 uncharacterized protein TOT_030000575 [Theileria orientalis strain Shintoku]
MDSFGFGILGGIFSANQPQNDEPEPAPKAESKYEVANDYTPPDVSEITQPIFQKQQKQSNVETLMPVVVGKVLSNINDPNQKLRIFNTPVFGMCLLGRVKKLEKFASMFQFDLEDATGAIKVHFSNVALELDEDDYVQVVGSLVLLSLDNFYVDSQHLSNFGKYSEQVEQRIRYHNVLVAQAAYNLDVAEKLRLQNKHTGRVTDLPGPSTSRKFEELQLGPEYSHVTDEVEILVLKYLKSTADGISKKSSLFQSLSHSYQESDVDAAIQSLIEQSELASVKDHVCLAI